MNPHEFNMNRKFADLYNQINNLNSNSYSKEINNLSSLKNKLFNNNNSYSSKISDQKLLMYDLIKKQPKKQNFYENLPMNIDSKIKNETKNFLKSRTIFDIPSNESDNNPLFKLNRKIKNDNDNFKKKYSEIEDYTERLKGIRPYQNKSKKINYTYKSDLLSIKIGENNISKFDKLKNDIIQILRNDKNKNSRNSQSISFKTNKTFNF